MDVRARLGMVFQEGALFDSFTVRENVGYRLYEETEHAARRGRSRACTKCSGSSGSANTASGCRPSSPAASAGASRSPAR